MKITFFDVLDCWSLSTIADVRIEDDFDVSERDGPDSSVAWAKTGLCPDPLMYEVHPPLGLNEAEPPEGAFVDLMRIERIKALRLRSAETIGLKHFLLLGLDEPDEIVEVIAGRWSWEEIQELPDR